MISWLRPPLRTPGGSTVPSLSSAAVTLLGLRVTRHQILRISALLTLRTLSSLIDIPLDEGVQAYLWAFLFSSAQAGVALAAAASFFNPGGIPDRFATAVLPRAADGAFLSLYARLVTLVGPFCMCIEAAVLVYEMMRMARQAEDAMLRAERANGTMSRPALLAVSATALLACAGMTYGIHTAGGIQLSAPAGLAVAAVVAMACLTESANIVEASFIAVYVCVTWGLAVAEELSLDVPLLSAVLRRRELAFVLSDEGRAVVLVLSLALLFAGLGRAERFAHLVAHGYERVAAEARLAAEKEREAAGVAEGGQTATEEEGSKPAMRTVMSALTLLAATFRVLLWAGRLERGEYLPIPCRAWQVAMTVVLYGVYVRM